MRAFKLLQTAPTSRLLILGLMASACGGAVAMGLSEVYEAALSQDPQWRAAQAAADAGRERLPQAQAQLMPNVSLGLSRNRNNLERTQPNFAGRLTTTQEGYFSYNQTLSLRQPIFRPALWAGLEQATSAVQEVEATLGNQKTDLAERVATAYFEVLLAQDQMALVNTQREAAVLRLDAARKYWVAGSGTRTDIDEAQAKLDMIAAQMLEAKQNFDYVRQRLQAMLNEPLAALKPLAVTRFPDEWVMPRSLADWTELAHNRNPQVLALRARLEVARIEVDKAKAGHWPTLDAVAQVTRSGSENTNTPSSSYQNRTLGLQLNVPLFAGGFVNSTVRQALAEQVRAEETLEAAKRDLAVRLHKEFRAVTEGALRVKALEQALKSSEQLVVSSQRSFAAGSRSLIDIANAEEQRHTVQRDLAQARYVWLVSQVRLHLLSGEEPQLALRQANAYLVSDAKP